MKKITAILCAVVLTFSLASCGGTVSNTPTPAPAANNNVELKCPYSGTPVTLKVFAADLNITGEKKSKVYDIYKDAVGNIEIEWDLAPPWQDYDTKVNIYLSSGDMPDIMWLRSSIRTGDYGSSDLFLNYDDYKEYAPNYYKALSSYKASYLDYKPNTGKMIFMAGLDNDYPAETFFANKTLLDKLGIALPTNLEEMEAAMAIIAKNAPEVTPFATNAWGFSRYLGVVNLLLKGSSSSGRPYFEMDSSTWKHKVLEDKARYQDVIFKLADWYKQKWINPEFATMSEEQLKELMKSNNWAFFYDYGEGVANSYDLAGHNAEFPIDIVILGPIAEKGVKPLVECAYTGDIPGWWYGISAKTKYPELCVSWADTMLSDTVADAFQWGVYGESYTIDSKGEKQWINEFLDKGSDAMSGIGVWNILGPRFITKRDDASNMRKSVWTYPETTRKLVDLIKSGEVDCFYPRSTPAFTADENEEIGLIMGYVTTIINENEMKFVYGQRSLSEWDAYISEVKAAGDLNKVIDIYNNAIQRPDRPQAKDRQYTRP